jgi:hypothetical protein
MDITGEPRRTEGTDAGGPARLPKGVAVRRGVCSARGGTSRGRRGWGGRESRKHAT